MADTRLVGTGGRVIRVILRQGWGGGHTGVLGVKAPI
jgi:hypothetical protein